MHAKFKLNWTLIDIIIAIRSIVDAPYSFSPCILETGRNVSLEYRGDTHEAMQKIQLIWI